MFNKSILEKVLAQYKQDFVLTQWKNENYKWKAVKQFQDNWDVNASDFSEMLSRSLEKTYNLLASANNFPKGMMSEFAKAAPEEVRAMFIALFDESRDVFERMDEFKHQSSVLLEKYGNGAAQHYQYENAISTYLWLRYPDKYYIYKFSEVKTVASELESDYQFRKGAYAENIRNFLNLYDEISAALKEDAELVNLLHSHLTDDCYPDPELKTLTIDVGFYISRVFLQKILMHLLGRLSIMRYQAWKKPISLFTIMRSVTTGGLTRILKFGAFSILRLGRHRHTLFTTKTEINVGFFRIFLMQKSEMWLLGTSPIR